VDDKLRAMARQAVADADPNGPGGVMLQAVKLLRDRDNKANRLQDYIDVVRWALDHRRAADLPVGSVVAITDTVFIKAIQFKYQPDAWQGTNGGICWDRAIDEHLERGAVVLRVGTGKD